MIHLVWLVYIVCIMCILCLVCIVCIVQNVSTPKCTRLNHGQTIPSLALLPKVKHCND